MDQAEWIALITGPLGAFVGYILTRKKNKAEATDYITNGASQAVEAITQVLETLRDELDKTKDELDTVSAQLTELRIQNEKLIEENKSLMKKVEELKLIMQRVGIERRTPEEPVLVDRRHKE